jgi:hypothetical protein
MSRPQEVRPGAKVPRSGIYQDNLSQRRATLVKGEPAPPTPHKAGRWQQVVDTASAPTYRGPAVDPAQWGGPRGRPHTVGVVGSHAARATPAAAARPRERTGGGVVLAFCAGVVSGHCLASVSSLLRPVGMPPSARRP